MSRNKEGCLDVMTRRSADHPLHGHDAEAVTKKVWSYDRAARDLKPQCVEIECRAGNVEDTRSPSMGNGLVDTEHPGVARARTIPQS